MKFKKSTFQKLRRVMPIQLLPKDWEGVIVFEIDFLGKHQLGYLSKLGYQIK